MEWLNILQNLGFFSIGVAGISYMFKKFFILHLNKDLERFKQLHSERMHIYKETFQMVCDLYDSMKDMVRFHGEENERSNREKDAFEKAQCFKKYIERNELFFDKNTFKELQYPYSDIDEKVWNEYHYSRAMKGYDNLDSYSTLMKVWNHLQHETPKIKERLADTFRKELGVK